MHKEKRKKWYWLVQTSVVIYVMHQNKEDCIHTCGLVMPTDQVHIWSVIQGKHTELDRCPHVISRSVYRAWSKASLQQDIINLLCPGHVHAHA